MTTGQCLDGIKTENIVLVRRQLQPLQSFAPYSNMNMHKVLRPFNLVKGDTDPFPDLELKVFLAAVWGRALNVSWLLCWGEL